MWTWSALVATWDTYQTVQMWTLICTGCYMGYLSDSTDVKADLHWLLHGILIRLHRCECWSALVATWDTYQTAQMWTLICTGWYMGYLSDSTNVNADLHWLLHGILIRLHRCECWSALVGTWDKWHNCFTPYKFYPMAKQCRSRCAGRSMLSDQDMHWLLHGIND
jgi:Ni,Fe-hydrogenase I cytochrome b subunit